MEANASVGTSAVLLLWQTCLNSPLTSYTMATISSYFGAAGGRRPDSDRVILAPTHISPRPNDPDGILVDPDEFKLNGKQYAALPTNQIQSNKLPNKSIKYAIISFQIKQIENLDLK
jgi:hypothetical protein